MNRISPKRFSKGRRLLHGSGGCKRRWFSVALLVLVGLTALAQLEVLPGKEPLRLFPGEARTIPVRVHNSGDGRVEADLRTRLYQASSATTVPLGLAPWKKLQVLGGQTVCESASLNFPEVKAETRFLVKWLQGTNQVIGTTEVLVYPPDLLKQLKPMAGEEPLGVLDPQNLLKPLLKTAAVDYQDIADTELEDYHSRLVIFGPFQSRAQMQEGLRARIKALAGKGVAVVWLQPPSGKQQELKPSFYPVLEAKGAVVVAQDEMVANLADDPNAQLNLVHLARLALHPEPLRLPGESPDR